LAGADLSRSWLTVANVQMVSPSRCSSRMVAGELLGDRQIKATGGIGLDSARLAAAEDAHVVADGHRALISPPEDHFGALLQDTCFL
jgi:hypothetical protein